jgi:hypothetical protein
LLESQNTRSPEAWWFVRDGSSRWTLTGYAQPQDLEDARAAGFDLHLAKPPDLALLARALAAAPSVSSSRIA